MAFLSGPQNMLPDDGDIANQITAKLPTRAEENTTTRNPEAGEYGYQMSPILEHAIELARTRDFVIPLCPIDLMEYEEREGHFITLDNTVPQFCWHHQKWLKEGNAQERFIKMHVMLTALRWYLMPPGYAWPELDQRRS